MKLLKGSDGLLTKRQSEMLKVIIEQYMGDRGSFAKTSGTYAIIVSQSDEDNKTKIKLPSGVKKSVSGSARAMVTVLVKMKK